MTDARQFRPLRRATAGTAIAGAATALLALIGDRIGPEPIGPDRGILVGMRGMDPGGRLLGFATDVTALGSGPVLTLFVALVVGLLLVRRQWRSATLLAAASESAGQIANLVKGVAARPRPTLVPHWIVVGNYSYPSAHATDSAAVALLLAALAMRALPTRGARRSVAAIAVLLVALIGCSRVYLGVHWPSDVLAGWSFGAAWALGWWRAVGPSGARE